MIKHAKIDVSGLVKPKRRITALIAVLMLMCFSSAFAQGSKKVTGTVNDAAGEPMIGVSIVVKGTTVGTVTDIDGKYSINIPAGNKNSTLVFTYIGYLKQEVLTNGKSLVNVVMKEDNQTLDEVVVVGYGVQKRVNMTGSVASVKAEEMTTMPVANVSNALGGRVSGLVTQQASGEPGNDASTLYLRGNKNPLVLVDGIESDYNMINMEEVESVTLLKDASAVAPYGLKGANGVVLITTKRGSNSQGKITLNYNGEFGWQKPTNTPEFMNAADGLRLKKKAYEMDGMMDEANAITEEMLAAHEQGTDAYPNTDWVKNYMNTSTSQKHNIVLNGGNDLIRAYVALGYMKQGSMFSDDQYYRRYNVRTNLDLKPTKTTTISADLGLVFDRKRTNSASAESAMTNIYRAKATEADVYSNGLPAFQSSIGGSMYQTIYGGGEKRNENNYQNISLSINQELPFLEGLSVKGLFNMNRKDTHSKNWNVPYDYYVYDAANNKYNKSELQTDEELSQSSKIKAYYTVQAYLNYANSFGDHNISGLFVYERRWGGTKLDYSARRVGFDVLIPELNMGSKDNQYNSGTSSAEAQDGFVFRVNYDYAQKYLVELAGRYDRTYQYAPGSRAAFFPSISLGWRISEEPFMSDINIIDNLKFRVSYGKSGNPVGNPFQWSPTYTIGDGYVWGTGTQTTASGLYESAEPNPYLTWESVLKANAGFDLSMWNGLLGVEFDVYRDYRKDKIIVPTDDFPTEYGIKPSQYNAGKEERYGVDLTVTNHTRINKDFSIDNSFVFGFSRDRQIDIAESMGTYSIPRFRRTGKSASQLRGYIAEGLFASQEEIDNWAYQSASTRPGDIKYRDINGDGKIDNEDETIIGRTRVPEIMYGYTLGIKFKNFDLNLFLQGTGHSDFYMGQDASGSSDRGVRFPFENDKPRKDHINSWTVDNPNPNAKYPRLSTIEGMNYTTSSFWVVNTAYLKLKSLELGYNFEQRLLRKIHVDKLRLYLNFYNLWTIYSAMPRDFDVENQNYNAYPQQFITSLGVNITF
ncbi:SusC/RagA family TonB-linked outer membrane protein [Coprobacter secundus]|uniref:SusC/RagA family TonB-linked outer membrane protein n=1 Tax=Coprobacter secundus TaxID=1501392 RepID=UPI0023F7E161|nr:TonB-dependent receptor [Coprobacter secundus]